MLENVASWIIHIISTLGYPGIILTMAIESALVPLPSEIIMPFSGFIASTGKFSLPLVAVAGAVGNTWGALAAYYLGYIGHERVVRRLIRKYGKFVLISEEELDKMEAFMHHYKGVTVLVARVMPGIRTVISLPAGIAKLPLSWFVPLTFFGSLIWSYILAYIGYILGKNWQSLGGYFHKFEALLGVVILVLIGVYVYRKIKEN